MRIEIDYAEATFDYQGSSYEAIGEVTHNTKSADIGIGRYEFWGHCENDKKIVEVSEYGEAEFTTPDIYPAGSDIPLIDPPPALIEAAQLALYNKTYEMAEEKAAEDA